MTLPSSIPQGLEDGRVRDLLALTSEDFNVREIAARLARTNRYAGATHWPYSVATHSVLVSCLCEAATDGAPLVALAGLLHDIPESFGIGDMISPIKRVLPAYRELEDAIVRQLIPAFPALALHTDPRVRRADERAYQLECKVLRGAWPLREHTSFECVDMSALEIDLAEWLLESEVSWSRSKALFLMRYKELTHE
jgi:hypothetical protein